MQTSSPQRAASKAGFQLARPAHLISFGDIIRVIEGPLALVPCVSRTAYKSARIAETKRRAKSAARCLIVRDDTARILDGRSLADAVEADLEAA